MRFGFTCVIVSQRQKEEAVILSKGTLRDVQVAGHFALLRSEPVAQTTPSQF